MVDRRAGRQLSERSRQDEHNSNLCVLTERQLRSDGRLKDWSQTCFRLCLSFASASKVSAWKSERGSVSRSSSGSRRALSYLSRSFCEGIKRHDGIVLVSASVSRERWPSKQALRTCFVRTFRSCVHSSAVSRVVATTHQALPAPERTHQRLQARRCGPAAKLERAEDHATIARSRAAPS